MAGQNYWARRASRSTRRGFLGSAAATGFGISAFALVGCGDDDDDDDGEATVAPSTTSGSSPAATTTTATTTAPAPGGFYSTFGTMTAVTLDIHRDNYPSLVQTAGLAYDNLIAWGDIERGEIVPELAASLPEQVDERTYVFTIRQGVKWQNKPPANGRELTIDDIRWNIDRQINRTLASGEQAPNFLRYGSIYSHIDNVEYTDATHFKVTLKQPNVLWLAAMCSPYNVIMFRENAEAIEKDFATFNAKYIVGTGPYIFEEFDPLKRAKAVRHPEYFLKGEREVQFFDGLIWNNLGADINPRRIAFEQKQIDIASFPHDVVEALKSAHPEVVVKRVPVPDNNLEIAYDYANNPSLSNPQIRQAIFVAIDRVLAGQQWFQGQARPNPLIPWGFTDWTIPQEELVKYPGYRLNKDDDIKDARALWQAGGGEAIDPKDVEFCITDSADQSIKEWFPAMLNRNLGTDKFSLVTIPVASLLEYLQQRQGPGALSAWTLWNLPDPRQQVANYYTKSGIGSLNFYQHSTPEMEDVVARSFQEFDRQKAIELMRDAQKLALDDGGSGHFQITGGVTQYVSWPYLHREGPSFITNEKEITRRSWFDQSDPSWQGRPNVR